MDKHGDSGCPGSFPGWLQRSAPCPGSCSNAACEPAGVETHVSVLPVWKDARGLPMTMFCCPVSKGDGFWLFFWIVVIARLCLVHYNKIQLQSRCWRGMLMSTSDVLKSWEEAGLAISIKGIDEKSTMLFFKTITNVLILSFQWFLVPPLFLPSFLPPSPPRLPRKKDGGWLVFKSTFPASISSCHIHVMKNGKDIPYTSRNHAGYN